MTRTTSKRYPVNGTSALSLQHSGFSFVENDLGSSQANGIKEERLSIGQAIKGVVAIAIVIAALSVTLVLTNNAVQTRVMNAFSSCATTTVTVHTGDTLWDIASAHTPEDATTDEAVRWIRQKNSLDSSLIVSGQTLIVPDIQP